MRELIYKDEAYKAIDNCICDSWYRISPSDAKMNIRHLVSDANEANRLKGEWIDKGWKGDWQFETDGRGNCWHEYECSECGFHKKGSKSNYCPNCGAKMKGADDDTI